MTHAEPTSIATVDARVATFGLLGVRVLFDAVGQGRREFSSGDASDEELALGFRVPTRFRMPPFAAQAAGGGRSGVTDNRPPTT